MKGTAILAALMLSMSLAQASNPWGADKMDGQAAVLTKDNIDKFVSQHKHVFVKFYSPSCEHSRKMASDFSKLAQKMQGQENGVPIAKVDIDTEKELMLKFRIMKTPALVLMVAGQVVEYKGPRNTEAMHEWLTKKQAPEIKELKTLATAQKLEKEVPISAILVLKKPDEKQFAEFLALSYHYDDIPFYYTYDPEIMDYYFLDYQTVFVVFRNFDEGRKFLANEGDISLTAMKDFIELYRFPAASRFDQKVGERIFGEQRPALLLFTDDPDSQASIAFSNFALENHAEMVFSRLGFQNELDKKMADYLMVTPEDKNTARLLTFKRKNPVRYKLLDVTESSLKQFLADWKADHLTPYYKSEKEVDNSKNFVKVVVGDTFNQIVLDRHKHVLLEAYTPNCTECDRVAPVYEQLAKKLSGTQDIVIAKMNIAANENPAMFVKGYPSFRFFPKTDKSKTVDYKGGLRLEEFWAFLEENIGEKLIETEAGDL